MRLSFDQGVMICDYCGSQTAPPLDEDGVLVLEATSYHCPACVSALSNASLDNCPLIYCPVCHGMLLDMPRFVPLLDHLREYRYWSRSWQAPRGLNADRVLKCPLCRLEMDRHPYGGGGNVDVDSCEPCGVLWLDRGELGRMVAARDEGHGVTA